MKISLFESDKTTMLDYIPSGEAFFYDNRLLIKCNRLNGYSNVPCVDLEIGSFLFLKEDCQVISMPVKVVGNWPKAPSET